MHWWIVSYLISNWSLVGLFVVAIAILGLVAFLAKSWKAVVGALALLALGFGIQWIDRSAYARAQAEELADQIKAKDAEIETLELRIHTVNAANELIAMAAVNDAIKISELEAKAHETPADATVALKRDAVRRVRDFRRQATGAAAAKDRAAAGRTGGHPVVLPIWKWGRGTAGS